ncbi:hypothetical protein IP81_00565 [Novosphingobium sp. AAP83]|uniref:hypothetical protein n=1 Tax=Novosphingobium sp. AAP83 TaxID=1523425 RepID=UPI0006B8CC3D|nr:hypothetical protein [Novosphingobium sp. AAP83]KPF94000.1 hypothetical protein IP81_00565 [Novosphingobium sp. AAP83]
MGQFSFGFRAQRLRAGQSSARLPSLVPGAAWTGLANSGFSALPADPVRTTAKPILRLMVVPSQHFTERIVIGVMAGANNSGSLIENMGLEMVRVHYEGRSADITAPSFQKIVDANGQEREYFGWWAELVNDGRYGHAHIYFEAIPLDSTMQRRVIGPFRFSPQRVLHDHTIEIAPSLPIVAGKRYQSITDALRWLRQQTAQNPLVTITELGTYSIDDTGGSNAGGSGYYTITASAPVTITRNDEASLRARIDGLCLRGANITLDSARTLRIFHEGLGNQHWFDGVRVINSNGRYSLWRKGQRPVSVFFGGRAYITECTISALSYGVTAATLARGNTLASGYNDGATNAVCVVHNRFDDLDSNEGWKVNVPALSVVYTGPESVATIAISGGNENDGRVVTVTWGAQSASFVLRNTSAAFIAGTNYNVANVVDWLNGLGVGFAATLLDDTRRATALSIDGNRGSAVAPTNVKDTPQTLVTYFDLHTDWYQQNPASTGEPNENYAIAFNTVTNFAGQVLFLSASTPALDFLVFNNAFHTKPDVTNYSQFGRSVHSHVVIVHNTWSNQRLLLRVDQGYNPDSYCMLTNNMLADMFWYGVPDGGLLISKNHLLEGASGQGLGSFISQGGNSESNLASGTAGDFTPSGSLASNRKEAVVAFDRTGRRRSASDAAGCDAIV